ncbi:MAG: hypothetical protein AAGI38_13195 [Bacteroidota bacterium]
MQSSSPNRTARDLLVLAGREPDRGHCCRYGSVLLETWRQTHEEDPPKVESEEPHGTFKVFSYPPDFQPVALQLLDEYFRKMDANRPVRSNDRRPERRTRSDSPYRTAQEDKPVRRRRRRIVRRKPDA